MNELEIAQWAVVSVSGVLPLICFVAAIFDLGGK